MVRSGEAGGEGGRACLVSNGSKKSPSWSADIFEPAAQNVETLEAAFGPDPLTKIAPCALSREAGVATLHGDKPGSSLSSLSKRRLDQFNISFEHREEIRTIRFEDYWREELNERRVDFMKLDVEGHELDALLGCGPAIDAIRMIQFEFGGCNIDSRTFFRDFWYFFTERGFGIGRITPYGPLRIRRYSEQEEFFVATNFIANRI